MNMQHNAYEINKEYRQEQERRSEKRRIADAAQPKEQQPKPSIFVQIISVITK